MTPENFTRTAAIIFSEDSSPVKSSTIQKKIIESLIVENANKELSVHELIDSLKQNLGMDFEEKEIETIVNKDKSGHFQIRYDDGLKDSFIKLELNRFKRLQEKEERNSIFPHLKFFISNIYKGDLTPERLENVLFKYFYELLNKNITAFSKISNPKAKVANLQVDSNQFKVEERFAINEFLDWNNSEKNKAVFALVSYAIEYSLITNHFDGSSNLTKSIKNKIFYLDSNVLYRAIGINGLNRKNRINTFLDKCIQSGQKLKISKFTEYEFKETVKHHVKQLEKVPFRKINPDLFLKYTVNSGIYEYYHRWKANRSTFSFDLFTAHILSELDRFCSKYQVEFDYKIPFDETIKLNFEKIEEYKVEISKAKTFGNDQSHLYDAKNTYLIEKLRNYNKNNIGDTKYFLISTDQKLREWDFSRTEYQPTILLPSQWMAVLLKYVSRTDNDYSSFTSFLKLNTNKPLITPESLQIILAGISEITEDFKKQEFILNRMVENKFNGVLNNEYDPEKIFISASQFSRHEVTIEMESLKQQNEEKTLNLRAQTIEFKEQLLCEKQEVRSQLWAHKGPIEEIAEQRFFWFKFILIAVIVGIDLTIVFLIFKLGWDKMEPYTYFLGIPSHLLVLIYMIVYGNEFNPLKFFESKKKKIYSSIYFKFNFSLEKLNALDSEIEALFR